MNENKKKKNRVQEQAAKIITGYIDQLDKSR